MREHPRSSQPPRAGRRRRKGVRWRTPARCRHVVLVGLVPLGAALALLAGCSDAGDPGRVPPTARPTPGTAPSEADRDADPAPSTAEPAPDGETPEQFVRRWVQASNAMQRGEDVDGYLDMSRRCAPCRQVADRVVSAFAEGGFVRTRGTRILSIRDRTGGGEQPVLDVRAESAPTAIKDNAASPVERLPGGTIIFRFRLSKQPPWHVVGLTQVPS